MRTRFAIVFLVALCVSVGAVRAEDPPTQREAYIFGLWISGVRVGHASETIERAEVDGRPGLRFRTTLELRITADGKTHEQTMDRVIECLLDGTKVRSLETEVENGNERVTKISYSPGKAIKEEQFLGQTRTREVELDKPLSPNNEVFLRLAAKDGRLKAGAKYELTRVSFRQERTYTAWIHVIERVTRDDGTRLWRVRQWDELDEGMGAELFFGDDGVLFEGNMGPIEFRRVASDDLEIAETSLDHLARIEAAPPVASRDVQRVREMLVRIQLDDERAAFRPDGYQHVETSEGNVHDLRLTANRPEPDRDLTRPIEVPRLALYLKASSAYESDAPEIREKANEILGDERNAAAAVEALCAWVFENLEKSSNASGLTARETLAACEGDCSEHTALYIALARAAGLPSRGMGGCLLGGDAFVRHAWAETWVGRWIPVDPAWGRVGTDAGYLSFGADIDEDGVSRGGRITIATLGTPEVRILAMDLDGQRFDARNTADVWRMPDDADAVVEHVVLRSGFDFRGRQVGFDNGKPVFVTPYGRTSVDREQVARIEYHRGDRLAFEDPATGAALSLPNSSWSYMKPQNPSFATQFQTKDGNAMGALLVEAFAGDKDDYVEVLERMFESRTERASDRFDTEIAGPDGPVPALRWGFRMEANGTVFRYELLIAVHAGNALRLMTWTLPGHVDKHLPAMRKLLETLRLTR